MALSFVGAVTGTRFSAGTITLDLTALTGGSNSSPSENDIVVVVQHVIRAVADVDTGPSTAGYTEIADLYQNDTQRTHFSVAWKRMGATPDTSVSFNNSGGSSGAAVADTAIAYVVRGVDTTTALDVTSTTAGGANTGIANAPTITPSTSGAWVLACGANISSASTALTGPSGYSDHVTVAGQLWNASSVWAHPAIARKAWTSGAEDPGAWSGHSDSKNFSWAAVTLVLRPAPVVTTLAANGGSYSITGTAATLERGRELSADGGTYAITGTAAALERGREVAANGGAYIVTGTNASLELGRELLAAGDSYTISGTDATLVKASVGATVIIADPGTYTITGQDGSLEWGRLHSAEPGVYAISGTDASLVHVTATPVSYGTSSYWRPPPPQPKKRKKRKKQEPVVLAPDFEPSPLPLRPVRPAINLLGRLEQDSIKARLAKARRLKKLRAADDEWLMSL